MYWSNAPGYGTNECRLSYSGRSNGYSLLGSTMGNLVVDDKLSREEAIVVLIMIFWAWFIGWIQRCIWEQTQ